MTSIAYPGQVIGELSSHLPGPGTHIYENKIHASIAGPIITTNASSKQAKPTISISQSASTPNLIAQPTTSPRLPQVTSTILGRVLRVQQRQLNLAILLIDPPQSSSSSTPSISLYTTITNDDLQPAAILRREDVRSYEKDKVVLSEMFRVGDIIRATVISLGDERSYYVSTAGNELGVVVAKSEEGNAMVPVSWREMKDVVTGKGEARKVARPV